VNLWWYVLSVLLYIYIKSKNLNGLASPCNSEMIGDHSTKQESSEDRKEHWGVILLQNAYVKHWFTYSLALLNGSEVMAPLSLWSLAQL